MMVPPLQMYSIAWARSSWFSGRQRAPSSVKMGGRGVLVKRAVASGILVMRLRSALDLMALKKSGTDS